MTTQFSPAPDFAEPLGIKITIDMKPDGSYLYTAWSCFQQPLKQSENYRDLIDWLDEYTQPEEV